ncbi:MAG: hypothetical protein IKW37_01445 [Bacteroidaceae bacterium]|nr:hypothetical protein [Bacteroidaceae bacterium]
MSIEHIEEVNKNIDHIEHVEKFNPFHDARGRFSSSRGMASYSANPNTKAGRMAIDRSTAAGYGAVMNVHRESKGENIRQNDLWIKNGQKPTASQLARAQANAPKTLAQARQNAHTNRVKGTMGATETAQARNPKATPKQTPTANQQTQQTAQTPQNAQPSAANARPATVAARQQQWKQMQQQKQQQAAQQNQQNQTQQTQANQNVVRVKQKMQSGVTMDVDFDQSTVAGAKNKEFKGTANGKDLTKTFDATQMKASDSYHGANRYTDKVCDIQGFNAPAKKVSQAEFDQLAKKHGDIFLREVDGSSNLNGRSVTAKGMKDAYTSENDMKLNGYGGRVYGDGLYVASGAMRAKNLSHRYNGADHTDKKLLADMRSDIRGYGDGQTVLKMAWNSKPKIANQGQLSYEFNKLSSSERAKYGNHLNTYAAAKGFDAMRTSGTQDYMVVFNRSKIAVLDD